MEKVGHAQVLIRFYRTFVEALEDARTSTCCATFLVEQEDETLETVDLANVI